jgi:hypothetical protein
MGVERANAARGEYVPDPSIHLVGKWRVSGAARLERPDSGDPAIGRIVIHATAPGEPIDGVLDGEIVRGACLPCRVD